MKIGEFNDRLERAKKLLVDVSEDAQKILTMAQMALPIGEVVAKRVVSRIHEIRQVFSLETGILKEEGGTNGQDA